MQENVNDLEELSIALSKMKKEFNTQMNSIDSDMKEFHSQMLTLSTKYPQHKDILEFIVFINDRIETNQKDVQQVISESINSLLDIKKGTIKNNIKVGKKVVKLSTSSDQPATKKSITTYIQSFADIKFLLISFIIIFGLLAVLFAPNKLETAFNKANSIYAQMNKKSTTGINTNTKKGVHNVK